MPLQFVKVIINESIDFITETSQEEERTESKCRDVFSGYRVNVTVLLVELLNKLIVSISTN